MSQKTASLEQIRQLWNQLTISARIGICVSTLVCLALIVGVGFWSAQPTYVPLIPDLSSEQPGEIMSKLESEGIAYKFNFDGSTLLVDSRKFNRAKIALDGLVPQSQLESSALQSSFGSDPMTRNNRLTRQLESRLAATISQLTPINKAWVHLGIPKTEVFARDKKDSTASITIQLNPGEHFSRTQANAIAAQVAKSVPGLRQENIIVTDTTGKILSSGDADFGGVAASHLEYKREVENRKARDAEELLTRMLGPGRAIVKVTADIDFTKSTRVEKKIDANSKAKISELVENETGTRQKQAALGAAGTSSNLNSGRANRNASEIVSKTEKTDTKYENGHWEETTMKAPGLIKRLSIAATVQLADDSSATQDTAATGTAATDGSVKVQLSLADIEQHIKNAVGFDDTRKDTISVIDAHLVAQQPIADLVLPAATTIDSWLPLIKNISLGVAAIIALLIGLLTIKRIRPIAVETQAESNITPQRARQISDMVSLARKHPELLSSVMAAWINENKTEIEPNQTKKAA